jgi:ubiquitin-protein ligase
MSVDLAIYNNFKDYTKWNVVIYGKEDTIWEGGEFQGVLKFPDDYPLVPPCYIWK